MKNNVELVEQLERILPGLKNSSSSAEDAMIRVLPEVIAALARADDMAFALKPFAKAADIWRQAGDAAVAACGPDASHDLDEERDEAGWSAAMLTIGFSHLANAEVALKGDGALDALPSERNAGIEVACKLIEKKAEDYIQEFGSYDPSTGVYEFNTAGEEYLGTLAELAEEIRALKGGTP